MTLPVKSKRILSLTLCCLLVQAELALAGQVATSAAEQAAAHLIGNPHGPLAEPTTKTLALKVILDSKSRTLQSYLGAPNSEPTMAGLQRFEADWNRLHKAYVRIQSSDTGDEFMQWWHINKSFLILSGRAAGPGVSLQGFYGEVYLNYKAEKAEKDKNPGSLINYIDDQISNHTLRTVSLSSIAISLGFLYFMQGVIRGATVAGPAAGIVNAFTEPIVRPIREKTTIVGNRLLGKLSVWLTNRLFNKKQNLQDTKSDIGVAKKELAEIRDLIGKMGYEMTPEKYSETAYEMVSRWSQLHQVALNTYPDALKNGRNIDVDSRFMRTQAFATNVTVAITAAEVQMQGIDNVVDRIIQKSSQSPQFVEETVDKLLEAVKEKASGTPMDVAKLEATIAQHKQAVIGLGATPAQADRLVASMEKNIIFLRAAATHLAAHLQHEFAFKEFNRALSKPAYEAVKALRASFGLDIFHREFSRQVVDIANGVGLKLDIAERTIDQALAKTSKGENKKQAMETMKTVNQTSENARAAARNGELNRPNEPAKTDAEVAKEVVKKAIRK